MNIKALSLILFVFSCMILYSFYFVDESQHITKKYTAGQFLSTKNYAGGTFTPDEKSILFSSDETGIFNIYKINIANGEVIALTNSTNEGYNILSNFPHDDRFLFTKNCLGTELNHIWMKDFDGSEKDLTPTPEARCEFYGWSRDGKSFYYGSNQRDAKYIDLYEMDTKKLTSTLRIQNDNGWHYGAISRNKRFAALTKSRNAHDSELYLYDMESGKIEEIAPHSGDVLFHPACFSPDSTELYFTTDEGSDFCYLKKYNLDSRQMQIIAQRDWDIADYYISYHGRYQVMVINQDAKNQIEIYDKTANKKLLLPKMPAGEIQNISISKSEKTMFFYVNGSRSPNTLYVYDFSNDTYRQLTHSLSPQIDPQDLVEAEIVRYASYDGTLIPALYYPPRDSKPGQKIPALIWMHGGPGGQSTATYNYLIQYLVNHGYAILAVNNRGSSGYGKTFYSAADRKHGEADLDDCIAAKKFLIASGNIEEKQIGIIGGSYGGYLTLAALAFRPEEMAVGIDIFGVSNWVRTLSSLPPWWEAGRDTLYKKIGHPENDADYLISISPLFHAEKITKPLLVIQGANDPRVLKVESDQIYEAVTKNNTPCQYVVFEDEGHGFAKKKNRETAAEKILQFLEVHLPIQEGVR